jgi:quercetin dioxygenase-like cupin family protein
MDPFTPIDNLLDLLPEITPDTIVSRAVYNDEQMRVTLFGFAAGQELTEHTSAYAAVMHFLHGEAEVTLAEEKREVSAGAWIHMAPQMPHGILARTPVKMLLTIVKGKTANSQQPTVR